MGVSHSQSTITFMPPIEQPQPQPGDHIYCKRSAGLYDHHGIYVGDGMVIHLLGATKKIGPLPSCQKCGNKQVSNGEIVKTCLDCFLQDHSLQFYDYGVPFAQFNIKRRGTCSVRQSRPAHEVIKTATDFLESNGFGPYNILTNNCENFAVYCKTGTGAVSQQVVGHIIRMHLDPIQATGGQEVANMITGFIRRLEEQIKLVVTSTIDSRD